MNNPQKPSALPKLPDHLLIARAVEGKVLRELLEQAYEMRKAERY